MDETIESDAPILPFNEEESCTSVKSLAESCQETKADLNDPNFTATFGPVEQHEIEALKRRVETLESQLVETQMAVELFKMYGFQPKQFD